MYVMNSEFVEIHFVHSAGLNCYFSKIFVLSFIFSLGRSIVSLGFTLLWIFFL